jgi:hypothetical protein
MNPFVRKESRPDRRVGTLWTRVSALPQQPTELFCSVIRGDRLCGSYPARAARNGPTSVSALMKKSEFSGERAAALNDLDPGVAVEQTIVK